MTEFNGGATLLLGFLLVLAGALKLREPRALSHAVYRLLPQSSPFRGKIAVVAAPVVGGIEIVTGMALVASGGQATLWATVARLLAALLYVLFVGVVLLAIRKGASCGCFSSFSDGPAGGGELGRSVALAALALTVAGGAGSPPQPWRITSALWTLGLAAIAVVVTVAGGRLLPRRNGTPTFRGGRNVIGFLLGRVTSRNGRASVPTSTLKGKERHRIIAAARSSASVHALEEWLGPRASMVDWDAAVVRPVTVHLSMVTMRCATIRPPARDMIVLTVSLPWEGNRYFDTLVVGTVDGQEVTATGGRVAVGEPRPSNRT